MVYSSLTHPLPTPSPRYKLIASAMREMGIDIADDDYETIDNLMTDENAGPEEPAIGLDKQPRGFLDTRRYD